MNADAEVVRLSIYHHFAETGRALSVAETVDRTGLLRADVDDAYEELSRERHLVLDAAGDVVLAHPFASRSFAFSVMGARTIWWGGCAWDSFAIPHLVPNEPSVLVATTCPACDTPHAWNVTREAPPSGDQVAHFLTPMTHVWDDVVRACSHQRIFCDEACVESWLEQSQLDRGAVFDLTTLWLLAAHWYEGRLDTPYHRREPKAAGEYFASVGLVGPFWGND